MSTSGRIGSALIAALCLASAAQGGDILQKFYGDHGTDELGYCVSGVWDVDGDGTIDVVAGAPYDSDAGQYAGLARVYSGKTGAILYTFHGLAAKDNFGWAVSGVADANGDGHADILVGAPQFVSGLPGYARVFSGKDGSVLVHVTGDNPKDRFGQSVAGIGHPTSANIGDFVVGAPQSGTTHESGYARHFDGGGYAIADVVGQPGEQMGWSVSPAFRLDWDVYFDYLVGAPNSRVVAVSGSDDSIVQTYTSPKSDDQFGFSISGLIDVNGDFLSDVLVGAFSDDTNGTNAGAAYVFDGPNGNPISQLYGESTEDNFGWAVSFVGSIDGDLTDEFVVGAIGDDDAGVNAGSVTLCHGAGLKLETYYGDGAGDALGHSVSFIGDADGDGRIDLVASAPGADDSADNQGFVEVILPCPGLVTPYGYGCAGSWGYVPKLKVEGCPFPGRDITVEITNGLGPSMAFLLIGVQQTSQDLGFGCSLLTAPVLQIQLPLYGTGPGTGSIEFDGTIPPNSIPATITMQAFVADPGGALGYSNSNGVRLVIP